MMLSILILSDILERIIIRWLETGCWGYMPKRYCRSIAKMSGNQNSITNIDNVFVARWSWGPQPTWIHAVVVDTIDWMIGSMAPVLPKAWGPVRSNHPSWNESCHSSYDLLHYGSRWNSGAILPTNFRNDGCFGSLFVFSIPFRNHDYWNGPTALLPTILQYDMAVEYTRT